MNDYRNKYGNDYVSVGNWMLFTIFSVIPGINLLVWLFSLGSRKKSKRTAAGALLLLFLIVVVLIAIAYVVLCLTGNMPTVNDWIQGFIPQFPSIPNLFGK